ncbi:hypothetical protein NMG60_11028664 [Bertholletia excelsa]
MDNIGPLGVRKGAWTGEEDILLKKCIEKYGEGQWHLVPQKAGLNRCRKSCRLRWLNYLRPNINRGSFTVDEVDMIIRLHKLLGNRWSLIAGRLPGRTANDVKNYWNTHIHKKLAAQKENQKKLVSLKVTKTNIIRPRPRTFTKNLTWLNPTATSLGNIPITSNNVAQLPPPTRVNGELGWHGPLSDMVVNDTASGSNDGLAEKRGVGWAEIMHVGGESFFQGDQGFWNEIFGSSENLGLNNSESSSSEKAKDDWIWGDIFIENVDIWEMLGDG